MTRRPSPRDATADVARIAATIPAVVGAALRAPARVRQHPKAEEVRSLRRQGWRVEQVSVSTTPTRAAVRLVLDGEVREVADNDPAFAAYAAALRVHLARAGDGGRAR